MIDSTTQKMVFSSKDYFSKCDHILSFLRIWLHLRKKSLMENVFFGQCFVFLVDTIFNVRIHLRETREKLSSNYPSLNISAVVKYSERNSNLILYVTNLVSCPTKQCTVLSKYVSAIHGTATG